MKDKKKGKWKKGLLSAVFAAALLIPSAAADASPLPPQLPSAVSVFNQEASFLGKQIDTFHNIDWQQMMSRHEAYLADPAAAQAYAAFLTQFDDLKGHPLEQQAQIVTDRINRMVQYANDSDLYKAADYWADGVQTSQNLSGDCDDYAIMKYFVMRYLGVPADKLFVATVSTNGDTVVLNHAILLLSTDQSAAPITADTRFIILDNMNGDINDTRSSPYVFFSAWNEKGRWASQGQALAINQFFLLIRTLPFVLPEKTKGEVAYGLVRPGAKPDPKPGPGSG